MKPNWTQLAFLWPPWPRRDGAGSPQPAVGGHSNDDGLRVWCADTAGMLGLPELARKVRVTWNPRMRTTAGRAWWPSRMIELNPKLNECDAAELWRTLKHELAHLVAYERSGRRKIDPHGAEWQIACADLGIPGEKPFHTLPFERRKMKRAHTYICPSCQAVIHRVKAIQRTVACYDCCRKFNQGRYHERFRLIPKNSLPTPVKK